MMDDYEKLRQKQMESGIWCPQNAPHYSSVEELINDIKAKIEEDRKKIPEYPPSFTEIATQMRINADILMKEITEHADKEIERIKVVSYEQDKFERLADQIENLASMIDGLSTEFFKYRMDLKDK